MQHMNPSHLRELRNSDFEIVDGQPDIDGWGIYDANHQKIGQVHDLLFDEQTRQVRYLIAHLEQDIPGNDADQVLVPIGMAELHESDDEVLLPSVTTEQLGQFAPYPFDALKNNAPTGSALPFTDRDVNDSKHYDDTNFYRNRKGIITQTEFGGIELRSRQSDEPQEAPRPIK